MWGTCPMCGLAAGPDHSCYTPVEPPKPSTTPTQKTDREEALKACPQIDRLLELSHRLYKASLDHDIYNDILAAASKELDAITDDMERDRLSSSKAEGEMREVLGGLVEIIDLAGLLNLSNGVQLGPTVWYVKASDRLDAARAALSKEPG